MISKQMIEKRNALMVDATKLIQGKDVTNEQRANFDKMMADVDVLDADIKRAQRTEKFEEELRSAATRIPRGTPGMSNDSAENVELQKRSFRDFLVTGRENRDLGVGPVAGSITGGNQFVAPIFFDTLIQAQKYYGGLVNYATSRTTETGAPMTVATSSDVTNGLLTWPESSAATEVDPTLGSVVSTTEKYHTGVITVTLEEMTDANWNMEAWIRDIFGARLARGLAKNISTGSTSGAFVSYLAGATSGATSISGSQISYLDLVNLWASVDPISEANSVWIMPPSVRASLMGVVDTLGRPVFLPSVTSGAPDTILGRKIVLDPYLPNVALSSKSLVFGDPSSYVIRNVGQFEILRDPYTYMFSKGSIGFLGTGRGGSFSATAAGSPTLKYLTQKSS